MAEEPTVEDYIEENQAKEDTPEPVETPVDETVEEQPDVDTVEVELETVEVDGKVYELPPDIAAKLKQPAEPEPVELPDIEEDDPKELEAAQAQDREFATMEALYNQYMNVDWDAWEDQDPRAAMAGWREFTNVKDRLNVLHNARETRKAQDAQNKHTRFMKRAEAVQTQLKKEIKGWGVGLAATLTEFAKAQGMSQQQIVGLNTDAAAIKILHKAYVQDQSTKPKPQVPETPNVVPLKKPSKGRGRAPTTGLSDDLPVDEWMRRHQRMTREG